MGTPVSEGGAAHAVSVAGQEREGEAGGRAGQEDEDDQAAGREHAVTGLAHLPTKLTTTGSPPSAGAAGSTNW